MDLRIESLSLNRGPIRVLKNIDIEVRAGEFVSIIGANGAGKTTLLWTIVGLLKPSSGCIKYLGKNITSLKTFERLKIGIALCPAERHVFPRMTVMENLKMGAFVRQSKDEVEEDIERVFSRFPRLREKANQLAGTLSGGEQQMLAMARSVMSRPKLLLLDEPSLGLAPLVVEELAEFVVDLNREGTTILLVEQNAMLALELSQRTYVLELGEIILKAKSQELLTDERVKKAYLGDST